MRALLIGLVALVALLATGACRDLTHREPTPDAYTGPQMRAATFNVRRFFDTVCESKSCEPGAYEELLTPGELQARATQLADAIRGLDADVISLQEIESQECLDALLARLTDTMPYGVLGETGEIASVDVAVLSKTPIDLVVTHRADRPLRLPSGATTMFSRELLEVHLRVDTMDVVMFAAHFKAKSNDDPPRRLAEAQTASIVMTEVAAQNPSALVILGGDLNDTPGSPPIAAMVDAGLVRVADDVSDEEQATYIFNGRKQAIDHLFVAPSGVARRVSRSTLAWQGTNGGYGGSDHFALTSNFAIAP